MIVCSAGHRENLAVVVLAFILSLALAFEVLSALRGLRLGLDVNNVLDDEVLLFGNVGFGTPQFFPTATRHAFFSARYTLR